MINGLKTTTTTGGGIIVSATVNDVGNLIVTLSNGQVIDAGAVIGPVGASGSVGDKGDKGERGDSGSNGMQGLPGIQGIQGPRGENGQSFEIDRVGGKDDIYDGAPARDLFDYEPEGFSYLSVGNDATDTLLYIKRSSGRADWFPGVAFAKPLKGDKGERGFKGEKGDRGLQGEQGKPFVIDQRGLTAARSLYDAEDPGFMFYDITEGVNGYYVKLSHRHGHWSSLYSIMQGEQGPQGIQGTGIQIDAVVEGSISRNEILFSDFALNEMVYSIDDGLLFRRLIDQWSLGVDIRGVKGENGDGLRVDTPILNVQELVDYEKEPHGFMALLTPTQTLYIKNYDYPVPGQDPTLDYYLPEYQTPTYKAQKQMWDGMSFSERREYLWSSKQITMGDQGEQGIPGIQGEKGDTGEQGIQGFGFTPDYKGAGVTPRSQYDGTPVGTSYLDTTYGMLYFRQTEIKGQWGPAIAISGTGGNLSDVSFISHGLIPSGTETLPAHNLLRFKTAVDNNTTFVDIQIPGTAHAMFDYLEANTANGAEINKLVSTVSFGSVIRPEIWTYETFDNDNDDTTFFDASGVYRIYVETDRARVLAMTALSKDFGGVNDLGQYELPAFVINTVDHGVLPTDKNVRIYLSVTFSTYEPGYNIPGEENSGFKPLELANKGNLRYLINIS